MGGRQHTGLQIRCHGNLRIWQKRTTYALKADADSAPAAAAECWWSLLTLMANELGQSWECWQMLLQDLRSTGGLIVTTPGQHGSTSTKWAVGEDPEAWIQSCLKSKAAASWAAASSLSGADWYFSPYHSCGCSVLFSINLLPHMLCLGLEVVVQVT